MYNKWCRVLLLALIGVGSPATLSAQAAKDLSSVSRLINVGKIEQAIEVINKNNPSRIDRLFFEGQILKTQRQLEAAISRFRQVLSLAPNHLNAQRELAHTLMLASQWQVAEYHFENLLKIDPNPQMRAGYREFLGRIRQQRPMGISGFFALMPSTNVNQGTQNTTFDSTIGEFVIGENQQPDSGIGAQLGVSGYFRKMITARDRITLNWRFVSTKYNDESYNSDFGSVSLNFQKVTSTGSWFVRPFLRKDWRFDGANKDTSGVQAGLTHRINPLTSLQFSVHQEYRDHVVQDYLNGDYYAGTIALSRQINPGLGVSVGGGLDFSRPEGAHHRYDGGKFFASMTKNWRGGFRSQIGIELGERQYNSQYPLTLVNRFDSYEKLTIGFHHTSVVIAGMTPKVSCSYLRNHSNIAFYEYDSTDCQVALSHNF